MACWSGCGHIGEGCPGSLWLLVIVDGGHGGVLGMLALPMCVGCVCG